MLHLASAQETVQFPEQPQATFEYSQESDEYERSSEDYPYRLNNAASRYEYEDRGRNSNAATVYSAEGRYRQPVSIVVMSDSTALISTKLTGEVYALDLHSGNVSVAYHEADAQFGKLIKLTDRHVAIADTERDRVYVFGNAIGNDWRIEAELRAPGSPNDLLWDDAQSRLYVTGKWSRRLYAWDLQNQDPEDSEQRSEEELQDESPQAAARKTTDSESLFQKESLSPFAPRKLGKNVAFAERKTTFETLSESLAQWRPRRALDLPMNGGRCLLLPKHNTLLIADAFGRTFATVDVSQWKVAHSGELYGHNISTLAATPDEDFVFFPHQLINEYARSVRNDITWGGLMSNNVRWLRTERLLSKEGMEIFKQGKFYPLGTPGNGAGDPSSMAVSSSGRLAITLGGTNRVAVDQEDDYYFRQADVGLHPVDCAFTNDESRLLVVNQFSDSISILDLETFKLEHVLLGPVREPTQAERGEHAFFNSRIGHDGWMSCNSCHSQGHTNGQLNDNFSDKTFGSPKRVLSLLGQAETMPYAWGGTMETLEDQVRSSIISTMGGKTPSDATVEAIAEYVRTLPKPPSVRHARMGSEITAESLAFAAHGKVVFKRLACNDCHAGKHFTSDATYDVGLFDENSMRLFNPPSLESVSQRAGALLHDGRAKSLSDVLLVEKHQMPDELGEKDMQALIHYLESL